MLKRELSVKGSKINLSSKEGSLLKKTLLCRTGDFYGSNGEVYVSDELLHKLSDHYNKQRENPQNENDYAPILLDHSRLVENVKGRLLNGLYVDAWTNPETGEEHQGLYGDLRIDDEDAIKKVESGKYSQVSLSFDEDSGEIFEVSFVAVEAARRSQVLSKGEKRMNFEKKFKTLSARHNDVLTGIKTLSKSKKETCLSMKSSIDEAQGKIKELSAGIEKSVSILKVSELKSKLKGFIRAGKMTNAEFKDLKINELAMSSEVAKSALLSAFEKRPVTSDAFQYGQKNAEPMKLTELSAKDTRELIKAQKEGKKLSSFEQKQEDKKEKEEAEKLESVSDVGLDDVSEATKNAEDMGLALKKLSEEVEALSEKLKKLMEAEKDEDKLSESKEDDAELSEDDKEKDSKNEEEKK